MQVKKLEHFGDLPLPEYKTKGAAGMDLRAAQDKLIRPNTSELISTGLAFAVPIGFEMQIRSRSGLSLDGIVVGNAPGTIDSDYRGEVKVILRNTTDEPYLVTRGDRIAQALITPVVQEDLEVVEELGETARGTGGFGSTGIK